MNLSDDITRAIRTGVPVVVGVFVAWLASSLHIVIGPSSEAGLVVVATGAAISGYYALARLIEAKWPAVGKYLLGAPKQ